MKRLLMAAMVAITLAGCSAASVVSSLASKPDITAQAGAENTKQTVGITAKQDASTDVQSEVNDSVVGKVDTSARKRENATSITAETIRANKIEVHNSDGALAAVIGLLGLIGMIAIMWIFRKRKKEP